LYKDKIITFSLFNTCNPENPAIISQEYYMNRKNNKKLISTEGDQIAPGESCNELESEIKSVREDNVIIIYKVLSGDLTKQIQTDFLRLVRKGYPWCQIT
jgi:hypothetical protein